MMLLIFSVKLAVPDLEDKIKNPPIKIPVIKIATESIKLNFLDKIENFQFTMFNLQ